MEDLKNAKITASPDSSGWAQVNDFSPNDPQILNSKGSLFVVLATTSQIGSGVEIMTAGRELLARLHTKYFDDKERKPFEALKDAVQLVVSEFGQNWGDLEIAACVVLGNTVYTTSVGGARVIICRDGSQATILNSIDANIVSASGYAKTGDSVLIATKTFFTKVPAETIKLALSGVSPEQAVEAFNPLIHEGANMGNLGALVLKFGGTPFIENIPEVINEEEKVIINKAEETKNKVVDFLTRLSRKLPERRIYVNSGMQDEVVSDNKKLTFSVGLILLIILAVSIGFGVRQKRINDTKKQYQGILSQAQNEVDEAISLASVSPDKSRELFFDSEQKLNQIEALKVKDPKIDALKNKINESKAAVLGQYEISPQFFLDLSLLSSGFKGDALSFSGGNIFILDKTGLKIVSVAVTTKKSKVVAGPGVLDTALDLASYSDRTFVLAADGIYEVGGTKTKVIDKTWSGDALIKAFAGNLYVLDKNGNSIYRYAGTGNTFGEQHSWLASGTNVNFSDSKSWAIDGSAYVLFPNSKISKFSLGSPQSFRIYGVVPEIGTVDALYADPENQYLYFLDRVGKRVVVTDKKGSYKAQYGGDEIGNATNLVVSEANKKIILLSSDKLLSIELKHL